MTGVYSGGLLYEYSFEGNKFGIVNIIGDQAEDTPDFEALKDALAKYPSPKGNGGFVKTTNSVLCPSKDASWLADNDDLPAIPDGAKKVYFRQPNCILK